MHVASVKTSMKIGGLNAFLAVRFPGTSVVYVCESFRIANYM